MIAKAGETCGSRTTLLIFLLRQICLFVCFFLFGLTGHMLECLMTLNSTQADNIHVALNKTVNRRREKQNLYCVSFKLTYETMHCLL